VPGGQRDRLEGLCRYALRPPVGQERLRLTPEGRVVLVLRRAWADGTAHLVFEPLELLERLAVLVPRPRVNLLFYHGVLGARARWRARVVAFGRRDEGADDGATGAPAGHSRPCAAVGTAWAELMRRAFGFDVLACDACGGRLRLVALIEQPGVIARILRHLDLPTEVPGTRPARAPPRSIHGATLEDVGF
jgi:hypothetical protein